FDGGDLTQVAEKRPEDFFAGWLTDPGRFNPSHRMPIFQLTKRETQSLAAYLKTLAPSGKTVSPSDAQPLAKADPVDLEMGKRLVAKHRCGACHELPKATDSFRPTKKIKWAAADWKASCLLSPRPEKDRPGYGLTKDQAAAVRRCVEETAANGGKGARPETIATLGRDVLAERNCLACHRRGSRPGIALIAAQAAKMDSRLPLLLPALSPPALNAVGDKLHDRHLLAAVETRDEPLRKWLSVRMPKFHLSAAEKTALTTHFVAHDRIPAGAETPRVLPDAAALRVAGSRLVTSDGFGCASCHAIGDSQPVKVALNARGTDLDMIGDRIRRPWFDRWSRDPARIVPRMEMPSIKLAVRGVLHENVDHQLEAVWQALNTPGFNPPRPNPLRVVRASGSPDPKARAIVLTDALRDAKRRYVKPFLIALPNRHNALFDLETGRLSAWWIGDAARQRTEG
ncbi:MAG: hypothetical protein N2C14_28990, partial [Planctomycetales bacterium]